MNIRLLCWGFAGLLGIGITLPLTARGDEDGDHDRARELYEHGDISALHDVIRAVRAHTPGDIVAVALVRLGDRWVYRFQIVAADGRRSVVDVDAQAATSGRPGGD